VSGSAYISLLHRQQWCYSCVNTAHHSCMQYPSCTVAPHTTLATPPSTSTTTVSTPTTLATKPTTSATTLFTPTPPTTVATPASTSTLPPPLLHHLLLRLQRRCVYIYTAHPRCCTTAHLLLLRLRLHLPPQLHAIPLIVATLPTTLATQPTTSTTPASTPMFEVMCNC